MDELKNWENFNIKHQVNTAEAFQRMCTFLFAHAYNATSLIEEHNHPGIETEPVLFNGEYYGFQCKYTSGSFPYDKILKSIKTLKRSRHNGQIQNYVLYCNKKPGNDDGVKKSDGIIKIEAELASFNTPVKYIPIYGEEILRQISNGEYYDIYKMFFQIRRNVNSLAESYHDEYKTKIIKDNFIDIEIEVNGANHNLSKLEPIALPHKICLLEGAAGSGKSIAFYYLFSKMMGEENLYRSASLSVQHKRIFLFFDFKTETKHYPDIINSCINDIKDTFSGYRLTVFFDAFDELSFDNCEKVANYIKQINQDSTIEKIFLSCRSMSLKKPIITSNIKATILRIQPLADKYIDKYLGLVLNKKQCDVFKSIINKNKIYELIRDPFLLSKYSESFDELNSFDNFDIFDLIDTACRNAFNNLHECNLPQDKTDALFKICQRIASRFWWYDDSQVRFTLRDMQNTVSELFPKLDYGDINNICDLLIGAFFIQCPGGAYTFKHKRIAECFYVNEVFSNYVKDIRALSKSKIIKDIELFEGLFLDKLNKEIKKTKELSFILEKNLINTYLGKNPYYGADLPSFMFTKFFPLSLSEYDDETIIDILENNQIFKAYFDYESTINNRAVNIKEEYTSRIMPFFKRINSSEKLQNYFKNLIPENFSISLEDCAKHGKELYDEQFVEKFFAMFNNVITSSHSYEFTYIKSFIEFLEIAFLDDADLVNTLSKIDEQKMELFSKAMIHPKTFFMLYNENIKQFFKEHIKEVEWTTISKIAIKLFYGWATDNEIIKAKDELKNYKDGHIDINQNSCYIYADYKLNTHNSNLAETALCYRLIEELVAEKTDVETSITILYNNFISIKNHNSYGRHYIMSFFLLQFLTSYYFPDALAREGVEELLKRKYLNLQLLSELKFKKPSVARDIITESLLDRLASLEIEEPGLHGLEDRSDALYQFAYLYADINQAKSRRYFLEGYTETIMRHGWRKDAIVNDLFISSFCDVDERIGFSLSEKRKYLSSIKNMFQWINKYTDDSCKIWDVMLLFKTIPILKRKEIRYAVEHFQKEGYWYPELAFAFFKSIIFAGYSSTEIKEIYEEFFQHVYCKDDVEYSYKLRALLEIKNIRFDEYRDWYFWSEEIDEIIKRCEKVKLTNKESSKLSWFYIKSNKDKIEVQTKDECSNDKKEFPNTYTTEKEWQDYTAGIYEKDKNLTAVFDLLKKNYYPSTTYGTDYLSLVIRICLDKPEYKEQMLSYLNENSGFGGFRACICALLHKPEAKLLLERYFQFCMLLTR